MAQIRWRERELPAGSFLEMMELERIDKNIYRAGYVFEEPYALYGGQVAAQSLRAAGLTVDPDRLPHSLHGYFLRPGDASKPTIFQVFRDRDGRSFSARRVVALQDGEVIFNASMSFTTGGQGPDINPPGVTEKGEVPKGEEMVPPRMFSFVGAATEQIYDVTDYPQRFWAKCTEDLGEDRLLHLSALTYLSDISSGTGVYNDETYRSGSSLDHSLWFHRPLNLNDWVLVDLHPRSVSHGRGVYMGEILAEDGTLGATVAQEALFRKVYRKA